MSNTPLLYNETGEIMLSLYGSEFALGWRGDAEFMTRMENLVFNFSLSSGKGYTIINNIITPKFNKVHDGLTYVLTTIEKLMSGLTIYFKGEMLLITKDYPEEAIERKYDEDGEELVLERVYRDDIFFDLAYEKAEAFYNDKIQKINFMYGIENPDATVFRVSSGESTESEE